MRPKRVAIVANARAAADPALRRAVKILRNERYFIEVNPIWEPGDAVRLAKEAVRKKCDLVLAAGGDGTLNEVVTGVLESARNASVGVLPYGTANDFAVSCHIPADPAAALRLALRTRPTAIDLGKANDRHFVNAASGGFPAEATAKAKRRLKYQAGKLAYFLTGLRDLANLSAKRVRITAPHFSWRGPVLALAVGNGRQAGGGIGFAPRARLNDGFLDVLIVPKRPVNKLVQGIKDVVTSTPSGRFRNMISLRVPWLIVEGQSRLQFNLDGQPMKDEVIRFEICPGAILARLPPNPLLPK